MDGPLGLLGHSDRRRERLGNLAWAFHCFSLELKHIASTPRSLARTWPMASINCKELGNVGEQMEYLGSVTVSAKVGDQ